MTESSSKFDVVNIGLRLKQVRESKGLSQLEFSNLSGISSRTLQNYEQATRAPSAEFLFALSRTFGVDIGWLLTGHGQMYSNRNDENLAQQLYELVNQLPPGQQQAVLEFARLFQRQK